jgi:5,5'-dehydrodivanillate O-demethylase
MLSEEKNRLLTEVGPGKPMGDYLRRYWHPIAGASEFDDKAVKPLRILGEDLVLYKDLSGNYGLVDRRCPHRNADMSYGYVEQCGLRCSYHGWQYDPSGQCIHQPFEETLDPGARMRKNTKIKAYPVQEKAGLLWAYMGPQPAPLLPDWELFNYKNGFRAGGVRGDSVQLVPVPGELHRPGALRVDAQQLDHAPAGRRRALRAHAPEAGLRGVRARLRLQAPARR